MAAIAPPEWNRIREIKRRAKEEINVPPKDIQWLLDIAKRIQMPIPKDLYAAAKKRKLNLDGIKERK